MTRRAAALAGATAAAAVMVAAAAKAAEAVAAAAAAAEAVVAAAAVATIVKHVLHLHNTLSASTKTGFRWLSTPEYIGPQCGREENTNIYIYIYIYIYINQLCGRTTRRKFTKQNFCQRRN